MSRRDRQQLQIPQAQAAASDAVLLGVPVHVRFEPPVLVGSAVITSLDLSSGEFAFEASESGWVLFTWRGQRVAVPKERVACLIIDPRKESKVS